MEEIPGLVVCHSSPLLRLSSRPWRLKQGHPRRAAAGPGPASLSPKSLALSRRANMAICFPTTQHHYAQACCCLVAISIHIYTPPARVPVLPCKWWHGLPSSSIRWRSILFRLGELALRAVAPALQFACMRRGEQTVLEKQGTCSSTRRRSAAPWAAAALVWLHICACSRRRSTCAPSPTWLLAPIISVHFAGNAWEGGSSATAGVEGLVRNKTHEL